MTNPKVIRADVFAYLTEFSDGRELFGENAARAVLCPHLSEVKPDQVHKPDSWALCGHASIELTLLPNDDLISSRVAALRSQKTAIEAEAQAKTTRLDGAIQSLLAIGMNAPPVPPLDDDLPF